MRHLKSRRSAGIGQKLAVLCGVLAMASLSSARADVIFDFDDIPIDTTTEFSDTQGGITATFSSPDDPGGFAVDESFLAPPFAGNTLINGSGEGTGSFIPLLASFDTPLFSASLDFALNDESPSGFTLQAFSGGVFVGQAQAIGIAPFDSEGQIGAPQGFISFNSLTSFDSLQFSADTAPNFAIDNLDVSASPEPAPVPEPGTMALMGIGLASLAAARRRRKKETIDA